MGCLSDSGSCLHELACDASQGGISALDFMVVFSHLRVHTEDQDL